MFQSCAGLSHVPRAKFSARHWPADLPVQRDLWSFLPYAFNLTALGGERNKGGIISVTERIGCCSSPPRDIVSQLLYCCERHISWNWSYLGLSPSGKLFPNILIECPVKCLGSCRTQRYKCNRCSSVRIRMGFFLDRLGSIPRRGKYCVHTGSETRPALYPM
jgi:hypothetical protein